jgi:uncharacterized protein (UPF0332 family)
VNDETEPYRSKALESLAGAQSELANRRYNNAANRSYYAAYNAVIVLLLRNDYQSQDWSHRDIQTLYAREIVARRKLLPSEFRNHISDLLSARLRGDYGKRVVSRGQAAAAFADTETLLRRILGT